MVCRIIMINVLFFAVLGQVRSFLPQLAAAESELVSGVCSGAVNIECVAEDEPHIEMVSHCSHTHTAKSTAQTAVWQSI